MTNNRDPLAELDRDDPVMAILRALSAPPGHGPLPGEHQVMSAFRAARLQPRSHRRLSTATMAPARLLAVKVALATAGVALVGGVALAGTGVIPNPLHDVVPEKAPTPADSPTPRPSPAITGPRPGTSPSPDASPDATSKAHPAGKPEHPLPGPPTPTHRTGPRATPTRPMNAPTATVPPTTPNRRAAK